MNKHGIISSVIAPILILIFSFAMGNANAQTKSPAAGSCCVMNGGKMMVMENGTCKPLDHKMTMKNGTTCSPDGQCIKRNGKKVKMKEGQCMNMKGKVKSCNMKMDNQKSEMNATTYTCPMHAEVVSDKPGKCPKCNMALVKKE